MTIYIERDNRMESCYINTAHPDFLNGHQAIAIVNEQLHPKSQSGPDHEVPTSKQGRHHHSQSQQQQPQLNALQTSNSMSTQMDNSEGNSFFGSFFSGSKKTKKSATASMEAVSMHLFHGTGYDTDNILIKAPTDTQGYRRIVRERSHGNWSHQ